jgi:stringent starvation protein B
MSDASTKPYLIRAIHEWCTDQGYTPYLAVSVDASTRVPLEYVRNGEIVLNVGHLATNKLKLGNELIEFQARFNGSPREVSVPIAQVTAIYARETGHGMAFEVSKPLALQPSPPSAGTATKSTATPFPAISAVPLMPRTAAPGPAPAPDEVPVPPTPPKNGGTNKPRPALKRIK